MPTLLYALALMLQPILPCPTASGFLNRTLTIGGETYAYQVYVPAGCPEEAWPVVLFLHGAGERGTDGLRQTAVGIGPAIRWHADRFPAVVILPQARPEGSWANDEMEAFVMAALEDVLATLPTDPNRVLLTGLSMGGYGTWSLAARHPDRFAALGVICGGIASPARWPVPLARPVPDGADPYAWYAERVKHLPIQVFHGDQDTAIPVEESRRMVEALRAAGADVTYTELAGVGHNAWDPAFGSVDFLHWLWAQRRP